MRIHIFIFFIIGTVAFLCQASVNNWRFKSLVNTEVKIDNYIQDGYQERTSTLQRISRRFVNLASLRLGSKEDYTDNPLLALVLIRRLLEDWISLTCMVRGAYGISQLYLGELRWPSSEKLHAAALGVLRAQWTYGLDISQMANGVVAGKHMLFNVTAADCFYIGRSTSEHNFVEESLEWVKQALKKSKIEDSSVSSETLLLPLALLMCFSGDSRGAQAALVQLLESTPRPKMSDIENINLMVLLDCSKHSYFMKVMRNEHYYAKLGKKLHEIHRELCNGEESVLGNLQCRYVHYQQPHLRFQPFKMEELLINPPVMRFHNVFSNNETDVLKEFSLGKMDNSGTFEKGGENKISNYRKSQGAWILPFEHDLTDRLTRRMADMTQLNDNTSEPLYVSRYCISGEYLPHYDYGKNRGVPFLRDRIATLVLYLSDVQEGGNTIFLPFNLTVKPIKNSAILFYNYSPSGEADPNTLHSACPVVQGKKWIAIKWYRNVGHEFDKPCGLSQDDSFRQYYLK